MTFWGLPLYIVLLHLFVLGSVVGSFLNVCIYRMPLHEKLFDQLRGLNSPPSTCPRCGNRIRLRDNIPILGWLMRRGRCFNCQGKIAMRYPLIELMNGLLFVLVYWMEVPSSYYSTLEQSCLWADVGPTGNIGLWMLSPAAVANWRYVYHMVLIEGLVVATFIDFDLRIIPDGSTVPAMIIGVVGALVLGQMFLVPVWIQDPGILRTIELIGPEWLPSMPQLAYVPTWTREHPHLHGLAVSLAGLIVGGGLVMAVRVMGQWVLKQEAMGFGDVVLMAMIGSFIGWQPTVIVFFLAPLCALVVVAACWLFRRGREIPYGPYLSLATLIVILGFKPIWARTEQIFSLGILLPFFAIVSGAGFVFCLQMIQLTKRILGIPLYQEEWIDEWTSADQLTFQSGERVDPKQGSWQRDEWPGINSGRGSSHEQRWRGGR
ncbi:MAG: A24 family peptidase [Planctomycetaceae bacterium]